MNKKITDISFIEQLGIEKKEEIIDAIKNIDSIKDDNALTIINFLKDQGKIFLDELLEIQKKYCIFYFFYYLSLGLYFTYEKIFNYYNIIILSLPHLFALVGVFYLKKKNV